jgi:hypothetical protein
LPAPFAALCAADVELDLLGERLRGRTHFRRVLQAQRDAGVRFQVTNVLSGHGITISEDRFLASPVSSISWRASSTRRSRASA